MKLSDILNEIGFVSNLDRLTSKELEDKLQVFEHNYDPTKILFSKFISLEHNKTAKYAIVTEDKDEDEFLVNFIWLEHAVLVGIEVINADPVPRESFKTKAEAISYVNKLDESVLAEEVSKITTLAQLTKKYNIKKLPKYFDSNEIDRYQAQSSKGQLLFKLNFNTVDKEYDVFGGKVKSEKFKKISELAAYLETQNILVDDTPLSDSEIVKKINNNLAIHLKIADFKYIKYIDWGKSIELQELSSDVNFGQLPYNQWKEGTGHYDDDVSLGDLRMDLKDFKAWLDKMGAKKIPKPSRY